MGADPRVEFNAEAHRLGVDPAIYGQIVTYIGGQYKVVGLKSRSTKYPVIGEELVTKTKFKLPISVIKNPSGKKRSKDEIMAELMDITFQLEPEALACDGERPYADINRIRNQCSRRWNELEQELGKTVSDMDTWNWYDKKGNKAKYDKWCKKNHKGLW